MSPTNSRRVRHGHAREPRSREYRAWVAARQRCVDPRYKYHHGRGIKMAAVWNDFLQFLKDVGPATTEQHTLGRLDPDKGYEPGNTVWQTHSEQAYCRRPGRWTPEARAQMRRLIPTWPRDRRGRYLRRGNAPIKSRSRAA